MHDGHGNLNTLGTIGGGQLEYQCIRLASERIRAASGDTTNTLRTFPLGSNCGQCCGGVVEVLFENVTVSESDWLDEINQLHELQQNFVAVSSAHNGRALVADDAVMGFGITASLLDNISGVAREMLTTKENVRWKRTIGRTLPFPAHHTQRLHDRDFRRGACRLSYSGGSCCARLPYSLDR